MPVLRVNHVAVEDVVPGVREVARAGHDKIDDFLGPLFSGHSNPRRRSTCSGQLSSCFWFCGFLVSASTLPAA
ncbi:hypothetical protein SBA7_1390003 [Candidatus Sulfotelmatobacter sp. SbA7]|nr:hypothetical protein SBA7_1390003 [Candidatus Sulfotelmatobacter sp. SbA7]